MYENVEELKENNFSNVIYEVQNNKYLKGLKPRGLKFVEDLSSALTIPIFAIGGINQENSHLVTNSGAFGVCIMLSLMKHQKKFLSMYYN